jgi:hypothetical protein
MNSNTSFASTATPASLLHAGKDAAPATRYPFAFSAFTHARDIENIGAGAGSSHVRSWSLCRAVMRPAIPAFRVLRTCAAPLAGLEMTFFPPPRQHLLHPHIIAPVVPSRATREPVLCF